MSRVRCPGPPGSCSPVCTLCAWCCVYGVLGLPAPVHRCARSACGVACTASWASRLLFTGVVPWGVWFALTGHSPLRVARARWSGSPSGRWRRVVTRPSGRRRGVACKASWASRLLFTGVHALCVRCPGPPGSCSPVRTLCVWRCVYGVLGLPAPVHRCAHPACGVACTASWASRLLFTGAHVLRVAWGVWFALTGHSPLRVARARWSGSPSGRWRRVLTRPSGRRRGVACTASWASRLLFTGVHALCVRCPGPPGSCSPVRTPCVWCCAYGVLGLLAPVHRCARSVCVCGVLGLPAPVHRCARFVCGGACTASWASRLPFTGVHALCVVLCVRCPGPPGSCLPVCTPCAWCCVCRLALLRSCGACCVVRVVSWDTWFVFSGVAVCCGVCVVSSVRCCVCGVLGLPAPVHRCACSVCCVMCAVWVWVRARVCHTVAASLRTLCFCGYIFLYTLLPMASDLFFPFWTL